MRLSITLAVLATAFAFAPSAPALAQPADPVVIAEEPTTGLRMPSFGISGEASAATTVLNPANLHFLNGPSFELVIDAAADDEVTSAGQGVGVYLGWTLGGSILPRTGLGLGVEFLEPSRVRLAPDPGNPRRLTLGSSMALGESASFGLSYQRYWDNENVGLDGLNAWNAGLAARFGAFLAAGFTILDLTSPNVANTPVQRRYELELLGRPLATDRLELGLGGRVGEVRGDLDAWLRWSVKLIDGLYVRGQAETVEINQLDTTPIATTRAESRREYRVALGLEVSFGGLGVIGMASGALDADDNGSFRGGTVALRVSPVQVPSIAGGDRRLERIELEGGMSSRKLMSLVARMRRIERDPLVVGVVVQMEGLSAGWATLQELRRRILALRMAGKKVVAFLVAGTSGQYYVASAADKVFVDPAGGVRLVGFSSVALYLEGLFDMIGVKAQFVKIREFKSAPEQYTRKGPSEPAFRQRNELLDSLYAQFLSGIAESRGIDVAELREIVNQGPYTAGDLEKMSSLVDRVGTPEDLEKAIEEVMGGKFPVSASPNERPERWSYPKVAVVYITGDIVGGDSRTIPIIGRQLVGGDTIAQAIAQARADPQIEAIILRIDSPGGSALASEVMSREVFKTRGVKPIICSMGDVAASGGYFAAAGCDTIFAEPMTVTGSIGIFNGTFDVSGLLGRLGITFTTYRRGKNADLESIFRLWSEDERELLQKKIAYFYWRFVDAVAKGRGLERKQVDQIARGRVWTGAQAKRIGLVDEYGGLVEALQLAKKKAGLGPDTLVELVALPEDKEGLLEKLGLGLPGSEAAAPQIVLPIPNGDKILEALPGSLWAEPSAPQARLPFTMLWQ